MSHAIQSQPAIATATSDIGVVASATAETAALPFVEAEINHLVPSGAKPVFDVVGGGESKRTESYAPYKVRVHDARPIADTLSLDEQGFALIEQSSAVADSYDEDQLGAVYDAEVEALVKQATGASRVLVFDHTIRVDGVNGDRRKPVRTAHNDYTPRSGPQRVRDLIGGEEAEALLKKRVAVVNVWRSIRGPVETTPLAIADARSMGPNDFVAADLVYEDRVGEIYDVTFNPDQRWFYFPRMERDEVLLLKCYDSAEDGTARFTAHTAFDDPTTPVNAAPRESIESRTLVFFDDEPAGLN